MEDHTRIFTRSEANGMLPRLRPLLGELQEEWGRIKEMNPEISKLRERAMFDAFHPRGVEYVESVSHLTGLISEIRDMGVLVKDLDKGLCDFPYMKADRVVYLCWHLGEDSVGFWHDVEAGFAGREPLGEDDR
jgi:hypothetical protein